MENELLGIGRLSALSGLPVSALRFYDTAGVLPPVVVDPSSGYRYYLPSQVRPARVVAHLRRVGLPLDDIRAVLAAPHEAPSILAAHVGRLEAGLADARREISAVHHLLETTETPMHRCTLPAADLVRALHEVRHAVSDDPAEPRLNGVYLDSEDGLLRVVATDRYRLSTTTVPTDGDPGLHLLLPTEAVDALTEGRHTGTLDVVIDRGTITLTGAGGTVRAEVSDVDFPAYRSLLEVGQQPVPVDAAALRAALDAGGTETQTRERDGVTFDVSRLGLGADGVHVGPSDDPEVLVVGVNRDFLLQALGSSGQLTLAIDDPISPLAIRDPARQDALSILMPVRLDQPA
ncbi:MerR family transcriptional regulator [Phycicoccus sonneratiae]|uniref:MerR family transcriptional regulator n=1 Tax=Phycicoccus sonneratiae TaxID=2807628 RepID=A0ABS2CQ02_9MICO|nr:MerR family transcriptional regulator [Phycicoccus sonneraticus]MBM6401959.1 MerR family transcriptional regulator [Phycicoccus sonneraticus]